MKNITRREMLKSVGLGSLALAAGSGLKLAAASESTETTEMKGLPKMVEYALPPLPYAYDALKPVLSEEILRIHHDKHHAGYVKGLNDALNELRQMRASGDVARIRAVSRDLAFNGSGHILHTLYWNSMAPGGGKIEKGLLADAIDRDFGSFDAFKKQFIASSVNVEASGWGILGFEPLGSRLLILQCERHEDLTMWGVSPIIACDVWEHAYYLQYQNNRADYVDKFFTIIDWPKAEERFRAVL